jgi:hypothetical protein
MVVHNLLGKQVVRQNCLSARSAVTSVRQRGMGQRGGRLAGTYERAVFVWDVGGEGLTPAVLGAPKIHAPKPTSKNNVSIATETTAKL